MIYTTFTTVNVLKVEQGDSGGEIGTYIEMNPVDEGRKGGDGGELCLPTATS